jgi:cell division protein ZapE
LEAAVLEVRLIHEHLPRYNRRSKLWRRYAYLKLTRTERFPRLSVVKSAKPGDGCLYLGPLPSASAAREVADAIERGDLPALKDELGDLLLQVVFHARMAQEQDAFAFDDVATAIADETRLLAFDEMMVTNSPDAMILSRLVTSLLDSGVTIVTTSNRPPADLYKNGLNREHFLPFIATIEQRLDVLPLNGPVDYRRDRLGSQDTWLVPNGPEATAQLSAAFFRLTDFSPDDSEHVPSEDLIVQGRTLRVPKSLKGVAVFSFKKLCGEARGVADYLAIARKFHTVILVGIPKLGPENRNEAARFVALIDALYEHKVKLLAAADAQPGDLYESGDGRFEFDRTISRLEEMRSEDYLAEGHL